MISLLTWQTKGFHALVTFFFEGAIAFYSYHISLMRQLLFYLRYQAMMDTTNFWHSISTPSPINISSFFLLILFFLTCILNLFVLLLSMFSLFFGAIFILASHLFFFISTSMERDSRSTKPFHVPEVPFYDGYNWCSSLRVEQLSSI